MKMRIFHLIKRNQISKMFNCIIFYSSSKTYLQLLSFPKKFEFLVKSKMAAILDDVTDPQQLHNPYLPYLVDHMTSYPLRVKKFPIIVTPQKPKICTQSLFIRRFRCERRLDTRVN